MKPCGLQTHAWQQRVVEGGKYEFIYFPEDIIVQSGAMVNRWALVCALPCMPYLLGWSGPCPSPFVGPLPVQQQWKWPWLGLQVL